MLKNVFKKTKNLNMLMTITKINICKNYVLLYKIYLH